MPSMYYRDVHKSGKVLHEACALERLQTMHYADSSYTHQFETSMALRAYITSARVPDGMHRFVTRSLDGS